MLLDDVRPGCGWLCAGVVAEDGTLREEGVGEEAVELTGKG